MIAPPPVHRDMPQPVCGWCRCFPCDCLRNAPCACGGVVIAQRDVAVGMREHQAQPEHVTWRLERGL